MFPITGTGSKLSALCSVQHKGPTESIACENPFFTGQVPEELLRDCERKRKSALVSTVRKATNLYRRVSGVSYRSGATFNEGKSVKTCNAKCLVCRVTLVKSSKDIHRSGVKLRCQCNVRVCTTCFDNNPSWYLTDPHFTRCPVLREFICTACACFQGVKVKVCCTWMCSSCAGDLDTEEHSCVKCSGTTVRAKRETRALWSSVDNKAANDEPMNKSTLDDPEQSSEDYRELIRSRVLEKVSRSRHLSSSDIRTLFHECFAPQQMCTCKSDDGSNPMCTSCTPVLTIMELLARNPRPLIASFAERAIPGRALARNAYDRELLMRMLNDRDLPLCVNGEQCKGFLMNNSQSAEAKGLPSLLSPESYNQFITSKAKVGEFTQILPSACILCLLFNQSASVAQMVNSERLYIEPHPSGPVYYFNVKLSPDVGVPEVHISDYNGYLVNFQGSVGSYKPTFYYNWRDMLKLLHRETNGKITISPLKSP